MTKILLKRGLLAGVAVALVTAGAIGRQRYLRPDPLIGFVSGNGRLEAIEIDIATKFAGRVAAVVVDEGDAVRAGQVLARMDTQALEAQLREAEAQVRQIQRKQWAARALVAQRESQYALAKKDFARSSALYEDDILPLKVLEHDRTAMESLQAVLEEGKAQVAEVTAAIEAAVARVQRLKADLADSLLVAPRSGRVLYRLAEPGEVLAVGGKLLTIIDLSDTYMTVFLSEQEAGKVPIGAEARIVLDALSDRPIPARVSFVAPQAQFTPKEVETTNERQKLVFRIKTQVLDGIDPVLKPGMPGVAYIRVDATAAWPERLS